MSVWVRNVKFFAIRSVTQIALDGIETVDRKINIPILINPIEKVKKSDKLFLALQAIFIQAYYMSNEKSCCMLRPLVLFILFSIDVVIHLQNAVIPIFFS
jgi:hypothetical protein